MNVRLKKYGFKLTFLCLMNWIKYSLPSVLFLTKTSLNLKMDQNNSEKACVYAALIMADDNVEITVSGFYYF